MADIHLVVATKRLSSDLRDLRRSLRQSYRNPQRQVTSLKLRKLASALAESWLTDISGRSGVAKCVSSKYLADLNVHFQRLLLCTERATLRRVYDAEIKAILKDYTSKLVIPLMQGPGELPKDAANGSARTKGDIEPESFSATAFVGHSFMDADLHIAESFIRVLEAVGITVATGEKPSAGQISEKVKRRIEKQDIFVGIFTRRERLANKNAWTTSAWVIDEKAYALGKNKKLILLMEDGVDSIGGIQGDYEYIQFSRKNLQDAILHVLQLFDISVRSMRE